MAGLAARRRAGEAKARNVVRACGPPGSRVASASGVSRSLSMPATANGRTRREGPALDGRIVQGHVRPAVWWRLSASRWLPVLSCPARSAAGGAVRPSFRLFVPSCSLLTSAELWALYQYPVDWNQIALLLGGQYICMHACRVFTDQSTRMHAKFLQAAGERKHTHELIKRLAHT